MSQEPPNRVKRRLSAILAADVAGYSRLMGLDEAGTARILREHRVIADAVVAKHGGRIVKTTGDGLLIEFPSVVDAIDCAVAVQTLLAERNEGVPQDRQMLFRIGINLGDILIEGDDILGDGVNVAARLEGIAEPGGICISSSAYDQVRGKVDVEFADLGEQNLKNIARPVRAYAVKRNGFGPNKQNGAVPHRPSAPRLSIVVLPFANIGGDPEQDYFADGVTESLTTDLSRIAGSFVIARNTAFTFKGKAIDVKQIGRELNVRYVLEGSVQRGGNRLRINAQLIDVETGNHLWAERFDKPITDLFDMHDEIVSRLANTLDAQLGGRGHRGSMATAIKRTDGGLSFGPFKLLVNERLLTKEGVPVELGARAYDILVVLTSTPNEIVSKKDLLSRVWPDVIVEEGSLRFHMNGLRKALGDGQGDARYITTLPGRGYCFVAPVSRPASPRDDAPVVANNFPHANLPSRLSRVIGRNEDVLRLSAQLNASRFVTIVGAGGVGKTTVAIAVGHHLKDAFSGALLFVDLGMLSDPELVTAGMASMLGLSVQSNDAMPNLVAYLRDKRILLILDTCEHLVEAVAPLAARIIGAAPQVHILATSREALRVEGEHIYRLDALACPPDDPGLTAAAVWTFPAMQLFMERAAESGVRLEVSDAEAPIIASICRKLDGVALAIELAARRVESYGLQQTAALLDQRLTLLWLGSRTAPPRQKTLQATLDWSFGLLTEVERVALRRLAVFVGHFTLDAALEVVTSATLDRSNVLSAVDSLVAKSLVATSPLGAMMRYRLLDTTRAYALQIIVDDADALDLSIRHASYFRRWLEQNGKEWSSLSSGIERASHFAGINNVRAALEWCFSPGSNSKVGVPLAAAAVQVFLAMSLLPECHRWSQRAILALDETTAGGLNEMHLQAALGFSSSQMYGESNAVSEALNRSLAIAEEHGDTAHQAGILNMEHYFHARIGDLRSALQYARRCRVIAETSDDLTVKALGHAMLGRALQVTGDLAGSRAELDSLMRIFSQSHRGPFLLSHDPHYHSYIGLARTLWLQGYPTQALELTRQGVEASEAMGHPAALALVLAGAASIFLLAGDLDAAQYHTDLSLSHAEANALGPLVAVGHGRKAELAIKRGNTNAGIKDLQAILKRLRAARHEILTTEFSIALAQGLAAIGRSPESKALIDERIQQVEVGGETLYVPELLRVKGRVLLSMCEPNQGEAEICFRESLELSRSQGARGWELRTARDLAKLLAERGESENGRTLLQPVYAGFSEGFETADLRAAEELLTSLR